MGDHEQFQHQLFHQYAFCYGSEGFSFLDQDKNPDAISLSDAQGHLHRIAATIMDMTSRGRAVIAFFPDAPRLHEFEQSVHCKRLPNKAVLLETDSAEDKEFTIKRAATLGRVTLSVAIFGRGTDFFCADEKLNENGGVHVIQTFFSMEQCEEVQIQGRTARQGQKGTYSLVLNLQDLDALGFSVAALKSMPQKEQYAALCDARERARRKVMEDVAKKMELATEVDKLTHCYFDSALVGDVRKATVDFQAFYKHIKKGCTKPLQRARMICLSDATFSMNKIWRQTQSRINEMCERIQEVGGEAFEFMWVAYRDYSDANVIERSTWTSNPNVLQKFVNGIECQGGGDDEEAVERALLEARCEHDRQPISRVVLIGDAPPHKELKGQKVEFHNHTLQTDYMTEAHELGARNVPVFCFRVGSSGSALTAYQDIARITGGEAEDLTADGLVDCICINTLDDIGGRELVAEYKARFTT